MIVTDHDDEYPVIWEWLNARIHLPWSTDLRVLGQMDSHGTLTAAAAFNGWWPSGAFMHVAADKPLLPGFVRAVFTYGFDHVPVLYGLTPTGLDSAHRLNKRLGFEVLANLGSATLYGMKREACRFIDQSVYEEAA